jgi:anti-sigma factor RsiW
MNERRFIELLNLYIDDQISPAEAAELESAVLAEPARRQTYEQYCRLYRACSLLGEKERAQAPAYVAFARSLRDAERKIAAPRRPVWQTFAAHPAFGATLAAACVAVVFVVNRQPSGLSDETEGDNVAAVVETPAIAATPVALAPTRVSAVPATVQVVPAKFEYQPAFAATGLGVVRNAREAEIAATDKEALEWMKRVDALPIASRVLADDSTFDSSSLIHQDRVFRSRSGIQSNAEFTAFQFQR